MPRADKPFAWNPTPIDAPAANTRSSVPTHRRRHINFRNLALHYPDLHRIRTDNANAGFVRHIFPLSYVVLGEEFANVYVPYAPLQRQRNILDRDYPFHFIERIEWVIAPPAPPAPRRE